MVVSYWEPIGKWQSVPSFTETLASSIEPQSAWNVRLQAGVLEVWTWTYYSAEATLTLMGRRTYEIYTHFATEK